VPKIVDHDARRAEIIEASWRVIAAEGLPGLSMRKIADAAGCTTGRLTHYFANREEIVLAALRAVYDATAVRLRRVRRPLPARERLVAYLEETLPLDRERLLEWQVWIAFWSAAATNPALAKENDERIAGWIDALTPMVAAAATHVDAARESQTLVALVNGVGLQAAVHPSPANKRRARETLARYVDTLAPD